MPAKKRRNVFYILLIPAGLAFVVTAFAYGFMAFQAVNATQAEAGRYASHSLFQWLRAYGDAAMIIELVVLAVLTVASIAADSWLSDTDSLEARRDVAASPRRLPSSASPDIRS